MKYIFFLSLFVFSYFFFPLLHLGAQTTDPTLRIVAQTASRLREIVDSATLARASCSHSDGNHHSRRPLSPEERVPVEICPPDRSAVRATPEEIERLINDYNISFRPANDRAAIVASEDFHLFVQELRKFPPNLMRQMANAGSRITLIRGNGVSDDPEWEQERLRRVAAVNRMRISDEEKQRRIAQIDRDYRETVEGGRNWSYTSGAGGNFSNRLWNTPTRIVVNHMYSTDVPLPGGQVETRQEGSVNLFLHEHGHALDNFYRPGTISNSTEWQGIRQNPQVAAYLRKIFTNYEFDQMNEGFAEAFAYFYGCPASQEQMRTEAPDLANFLERLGSRNMRDFR